MGMWPRKETTSLESLILEVLTALAGLEEPAPELIARVTTRIREAPVEEIHLGLHALWPYSRHIDREEWLKSLRLFSDLEAELPLLRLRTDAREWLEDWERESAHWRATSLAELERLAPAFRAYVERSQQTSAAATQLSATLTPDAGTGGTPVDVLDQYLPPIDEYGYDSFWYHDLSSFTDTLHLGQLFLLTVTLEVRARLNEDTLFWAVLGRIYEPFAPGDPEELEEDISTASAEILALRVRAGYADLLDYLNYFDEYRTYGDELLEPEYEKFLAAVERATSAECDALFHKLCRLEFGPYNRPPHPVEESLPVADGLWMAILAKPDLSVTLLARAGLFYWISRDPAKAPALALVALGRVCEGDCFDFWRIPPFLVFWTASKRAASEGDWTLAAHCWKRALVDIVVFDRALSAEMLEQVHAFSFDPRSVRDIHARLRTAEPAQAMFRLALELAIDSLQRSDLGEWSQVHFVLLELSRRFGANSRNDDALIGVLGQQLYRQIDQHTRDLLAKAEAAWSTDEHNVDPSVDYALIGWTYRRAIENEWRLRLEEALTALDSKIKPNRASLGQMLHVLRGAGPIGQQLVRRRLAGIPSNSHLFNQMFLRRASKLVDTYLNEATHRRLDRSQCTALRTQLLNGRFLRDLLACVQDM